MADISEIRDLSSSADLTCGHWAAEAEAEEYLASYLSRTGLFKVHRQVTGRTVAHRHFQEPKGLHADLLLVPNDRFIDAGWTGGALVIEVKRSGEKTGPGYSQLMDYMGAAWPLAGGVCVAPDFGFLFPVAKQHGPLASILAHQHIGTASIDRGQLSLYAGECRVLTVDEVGGFRFGQTRFGRSLGAR
jgi:hypothetical protein